MLVIIFLATSPINAQYFLKPFDHLTKKMPAYITLETGEEIECNIRKIKLARKGLIKELQVKVNGKKVTYAMEDIKHAYLPQSSFDSFLKDLDFINDATQWVESDLDSERLKEGYAFFEKIDIILKGDERKLLMQNLNPFPNTRVKVYHDPQAGEKGGMRLGGIKVVKSLESNYYVSKDGAIAKRLRSKDFKKQFGDLLGDCRSVKSKYGKKVRWKNFEKAVQAYNTDCSKK